MSIPTDKSQCPQCWDRSDGAGIIRLHARGATCQYCGASWSDPRTIPFSQLLDGDLFVTGGSYNDENYRIGKKIHLQEIELGNGWLTNVQFMDNHKYGFYGPEVRVLPIMKVLEFLPNANQDAARIP